MLLLFIAVIFSRKMVFVFGGVMLCKTWLAKGMFQAKD